LGARKKGENRFAGRSLEYTVNWSIELGGYYSNLVVKWKANQFCPQNGRS
jgi:hypothetical protein